MATSYAPHIDVDELPLDTRIELAREKERRSNLPTDAGEGASPQPDSLATQRADDDPDLNILTVEAEKRGCLFIHPGRAFSMIWGFLTLLVVMWVVLSLPFKLAFLSERWGGRSLFIVARSRYSVLFCSVNTGDPFFAVSIVVDIFFCTDVVLNFYTGFYDNNETLVVDGQKIKVGTKLTFATRVLDVRT